MKTKIFTFLICMVLFTTGFSQTYSGGSGTAGSPYQIATKADLKYLSEHSADWSKYFIQTADIVFEDADFQNGGDFYNSGAGFSPIGNSTTKFTGSYDGQGFSITGLYIYRPGNQYIGLFGYITGNGSASISNLYIQGTVSGATSVGILIGNITSSNITITNCHSNADITSAKTTSDSNADTGGLIGIIASGAPTITYCSSSGSVTAQGLRNVGGLIGYLNSGTVQKSFSTANVVNSASNQGNTGGFIGGINSNGNNTLIEDCFATGNVSGGANNNSTEWRNGIGGFIGTKRTEYNGYTKTIRNCYATGIVTQTGSSSDIGGFIGRFATNYASAVSPTITNCYWDTQRTTQASSASGAGTGLTTAQMKVQGNFTSWDFTNTWRMSSTITYDGYPTLEWGKGFATAPISSQIADLSNLVYVAENSSRWATSYTQTSDVNAWWTCGWDYQKGWTPIGNNTTKYTGTTYDGDDHEINHLFINRSTSDFQGLFGYLNNAEVKDLGLYHVNISARSSLAAIAGSADNGTISNCFANGKVAGIGAADFTGGLIGDSRGNSLVENCYTNMAVSGLHHVGGLAGRVLHDGSTSIVRYCYSLGTVTGTGSHVGGLAGGNSGTITNSYSLVNVGGTGTNVGGLVGNNWYGIITNSYSAGSVTGSSSLGGLVGATTGSTVTNSFWDTQTSGRATSNGGTGKTTTEMKTQSTFTDWDFTTIWNISDISTNYISYPYLRSNEQEPLPGYEDILVIWNGSVNTEWNTADNWSNNAIPSSKNNVTIPSGGNQPFINSGVGADCNNLTVNASATLTVQDGGSLITSGTITNNGTITMQQTLTGAAQAWHMVSGPAVADISDNNWHPTLGNDDFYAWNEPDPGTWVNYHVTSGDLNFPAENGGGDNFVAGKGYLVAYNTANPTKSITGTPNTGNVTFTLKNSGSKSWTYTGGWNLLGNPYPSAIDWNAVDHTITSQFQDNFAYVYNPNKSGGGDYITIDGGSSDAFIAPFQGFMVITKTSSNNQTFTFTNAMRDHGGSFLKNQTVTDGLLLRLSHENWHNETTIRLREESEPTRDRQDALKLFSFNPAVPQLYSQSSDLVSLAINSIPTVVAGDLMALGMLIPEEGVFTLSLQQTDGKLTANGLYLEDRLTDTFHNISDQPYAFTAEKGSLDERFLLHFGVVGVEVPTPDQFILVWKQNNLLYLKGAENYHEAGLFDSQGRLLQHTPLSGDDLQTMPSPQQTGMYLIRLLGENHTVSKKLIIK